METFKRAHKAWWVLVMVALVAAPAALLQGCTDLEEETFGVVTPDNFFQSDEEVLAAVAPVYAQLRRGLWQYHNLSQHSSDETLVPVRGTDWDDAGRWRSMNQHTWDRALVDLNDAWVDAFTGVARANTVIDAINNATVDIANRDQLIAELRFLRAWYYFQLLDFFGRVPIVETPQVDTDNPPGNASRAEVFSYVETELLAVRDQLPDSWGSANFGRATRGAANGLLARLYLNAEILAGTLTASGITKAAPRWSDAINAANAVINSGQYELTNDYLDNFRVDNHNSPELIFVTPTLARESGELGLTFIMRTLHYNQIPQTPWNGFIVLTDVYNSFDPDDRRADVFLVGQMYESPNSNCIGKECFSDTNSAPLEDRKGNPLNFTTQLFQPDGNPVPLTDPQGPRNVDETSGVRVVKWEIDASRDGGHNGNDYAWLRLADMYLIRAEANFELGNTADALNDLNMLRERAFGDSDHNLTTVTAEIILQERQYELLWEGVRRQDLIRHDLYTTKNWDWKQRNDPFRNVFAIPQVQIDANPNLTQNPGY